MSGAKSRPEITAVGLGGNSAPETQPIADVAGKTAFVTGAASGIGRAISTTLVDKGANVMLADYDENNLAETLKSLGNRAGKVSAVKCDVADPQSLKEAAQETLDAFGKVHIVVNNAGVSLGGETGCIDLDDWRWIIDVNLLGVAYGQEIFTPLIKEHGEGGQIVNTASMAGHYALPMLTPYTATKYAVVGMSEGLRTELAPHNIGVSVLCPGWVKTKIHEAGEKRPSAVETPTSDQQSEMGGIFRNFVEGGIDPSYVGEWVVHSIEANRAYIFTQPDMRESFPEKMQVINRDYDACEEFFRSVYAEK